MKYDNQSISVTLEGKTLIGSPFFSGKNLAYSDECEDKMTVIKDEDCVQCGTTAAGHHPAATREYVYTEV